MKEDQFIDAVQTAGIAVIAGVLVFVVIRLNRALTAAAETVRRALGESLRRMNQLDENVRRTWERIDAVEERMNRLEKKD